MPQPTSLADGAHSLAVVLSGQVRTFVSPTVHQSIRNNVLDALCPTADTFLSTNGGACTIELFLCGSLGKGGCGSMAQKNAFRTQVTMTEYRAAIDSLVRRSTVDTLFKRATISVAHIDAADLPSAACDDSLQCGSDERRWCSGSQRSCSSSAIHPAITEWNTTAHRLVRKRVPLLDDGPFNSIVGVRTMKFHVSRLGVLRWMRCLRHLRTREAQRSTPFDWVLVARFDLGYFAPLPPLSAFTNQRGVHLPANHYSPLNDFFALMPREHAEVYLSTASQACCTSCWLRSPPLPWDQKIIDRSKQRRMPGLILDMFPHGPEQWLAAQLYVHAVPVYGGFFPIVLTRDRSARGRGGLMGECERHRVCNTTSVSYTQTAVGDLHPQRELPGDSWPPCPSDRVEQCARFFRPRSISH